MTEPDEQQQRRPPRDRPWLLRTYAGHSSAAESNALYRRNLAKGQTGLSVAFDLPTQTGYDADHDLARGEVGRVGVPVGHLGDMRALFDGIPLERTNTSMTINATAMWLLALYQVVAEEQGADIAKLAGTTQNDIIKEYLSRGTYVFPPGPSLRLTTDVIAYTVARMPRWNPINVCSYHLQEAGATPVQEIAYAMCTAIAVLDAVRDSGQVPPERMSEVVGAGVLLRQRGRPLRRGDVQDAGLRPDLGQGHAGAVRNRRPRPPPLPLWRPGQLAGPDRGAAGEQRPADRPGDAGRHPLQGCPGPGRAAPRLERGAGPAAALGPAVEPAHPAGPRVRVGPAGVRRPVQRLPGGGGQDGGAAGRRRGGDRQGAGDGRGGTGGRVRLPESPARRLARGPAGTHRVWRGQDRGRQLFRDHRAQPAHRRPGRRGPAG